MGEVTPIARVIPYISDAQKTYNAKIKAFLERVTGFPISRSNIFQLDLEHDGTIKVGRMSVQVGSRYGDDEPIIAIFEIKDWYIICYRSRGALVGSPKYIDGKDVVEVIEFRDARHEGLLQSKTALS